MALKERLKKKKNMRGGTSANNFVELIQRVKRAGLNVEETKPDGELNEGVFCIYKKSGEPDGLKLVMEVGLPYGCLQGNEKNLIFPISKSKSTSIEEGNFTFTLTGETKIRFFGNSSRREYSRPRRGYNPKSAKDYINKIIKFTPEIFPYLLKCKTKIKDMVFSEYTTTFSQTNKTPVYQNLLLGTLYKLSEDEDLKTSIQNQHLKNTLQII